MAGTSVLVIDDHALFADVLQARLSQEPDLGPVEVASSIRSATSRLAATQPSVVVLDIVLNDGSGLDLAQKIREISPQSKVVMLTAVDSVDDVLTALSRGARAWVPKTVDSGHLVRIIRGVCRGEAWIAPDLLGRILTTLSGARVVAPDPLAMLTARERDVLQCMVDGLCPAEIATRLAISTNTVRTHTQKVIAKLGVHSTLECVAIAMRSAMSAAGGPPAAYKRAGPGQP
jgi:two-component system NarL family response regulator